MTKESKIETLKNYLKSAASYTSQFKALWQNYSQKKKYVSVLVALACEKNREPELIFLLSDQSLHHFLKEVRTSDQEKSLFPIGHAFYYAALTCVYYLRAHQPLLLQKFSAESLQEITEAGLRFHRRQGANFPGLQHQAAYNTKLGDYDRLLQPLDVSQSDTSVAFDLSQLELSDDPENSELPEHVADNAETSQVFYFNNLMLQINRGELDAVDHALSELTQNKAELTSHENDLAQLARAFLTTWKLGQWVIKDKGVIQNIHMNRDAVLQSKSTANLRKLDLIERLFYFMEQELFNNLCEGDHLHPLLLEKWYLEQVNTQGKHFPEDPSDDSDSEDEQGACSLSRRQQHQEMAALYSVSFWQRTQKKALLAEEKSAAKLEANLKQKLKDRAKLQPPSPSHPANPVFIPVFRGNNYLEDRWSNASKRKHYYLDEVKKPHYSEAVMMDAANFYQQEDSFTEPVKRLKMDETAQAIQRSHHAFRETGPCIAFTRKPSQKLFIFNSFNDYLQHHYSNGISDHLKQLVGMLKAKNEWLRNAFVNAYNYAISTSDRPYHSLRYALGLKEYYHNSFTPRYDRDGSIQNFHAGKLYIFLFTLEDMRDPDVANRVNSMLQNGQCPVLRDISSELETTLFGKVEGQHVVYQFQLRFPSFNKAYKKIYQVKYGMDEALYAQFQSLLTSLPFEYTSEASSKRDEVIELLKEWLCAYYEVMALEMARKLAAQRGGELMYYNEQNQCSSSPPQRPLVNGKEHLLARRKMHILEETRRYIAKTLKPEANMSETEVIFVNIDLREEVKKLLSNQVALLKIAKGVGAKLQLTEAEDELCNTACAKPNVRQDDVLDEMYGFIVGETLRTNLDTFVSLPIKAPKELGLFAWQELPAEFKTTADLASAYYL